MLSFECIKNEKSVYFLLTSASFAQTFLIFWASDLTDFLYVQFV